MKLHALFLQVTLVLAASSAAHAIDVRVDFAAFKPAPTPFWNTLDFNTQRNTTVPNLVEFSTGVSTGVSITTAGVSSFIDANDNWTAGDKDWVQAVAALDGFAGGSVTAVFSNVPAGSYRVEVVSSHRTAIPSIADLQVNSLFADANFNNTPGVFGDNFNSATDGNTPGNWLIWNNVSPNAGSISVSLSTVSNFSVLNAIRISNTAVVPEPATASLALVGIGGLMMRRRRVA